MKYCTKCGKALSEDDLFCGSCGYRIQDQIVTEAVDDMPPAEIIDTDAVNPKKKGKKKFIIVGLLLVALAAWLIYPSLKLNGASVSPRQIAAFEKLGFTVDEYGDLTEYTGDETDIIIPDGVLSIRSLNNFAPDEINDTITSVEIPDSVTAIFGGFENYTTLTSVKLSNSMKIIYDGTFAGCTALTSIEIPESVTKIGNSTFSGCTSLTEIEIPESVTEIGSSVFSGCTSLTEIVIPDSITEISDSAFSGCTSLTNIVIPDSVTGIGVYTFKDCTSLESIDLPSSLMSINGAVFSGCTSLTDVVIPASVTRISDQAFYECTSLTSIVIPDSVTSIGSWAFHDCVSLTDVVIPASVTSMGQGIFNSCVPLENVYILNPNLEDIDPEPVLAGNISDIEYAIVHPFSVSGDTDFVMYGYADSTAEAFADYYDLAFVPIDGYDLDDILSGKLDKLAASLANNTTMSALVGTQWHVIKGISKKETADLSGEGMYLYLLENGTAKISGQTSDGCYYDNNDDYSDGFKVTSGGDTTNAYINGDSLVLESYDGAIILLLERVG